MDLWWRLIGVLFFCAGLSHAGSNFGIPSDHSGEFYCCVNDKNEPNPFLTRNKQCVHIWMHLKIESQPDKNEFLLQRMFFLCKTDYRRGNSIDRALLGELSQLLDEDRSATTAVSLETYILDQHGYIKRFNIHSRKDHTNEPLNKLVCIPEHDYQLLVSSRSKIARTANAGFLNISGKNIIPALFLPIATPPDFSYTACYEPLHDSYYYEFNRSGASGYNRTLPVRLFPNYVELELRGIMKVRFFRDTSIPGLPEKICLSLPLSSLPRMVQSSHQGAHFREELDLTLKIKSPDTTQKTTCLTSGASSSSSTASFPGSSPSGRKKKKGQISHSSHAHISTVSLEHEISEQMGPAEISQVIDDLTRLTAMDSKHCVMTYGHVEMSRFIRLYYRGLQPSERGHVRDYANRLICRGMPHPVEDVDYMAFTQDLTTFRKEYDVLIQFMDHSNNNQFIKHCAKCYQVLSKDKTEQACEKVRETLSVNNHSDMVTAMETLGSVCQHHKKTLPEEARLLIMTTLDEGFEPLVRLLESKDHDCISQRLPVRLAWGLIRCWIITPGNIIQPHTRVCKTSLLPCLTSAYSNYLTYLKQTLDQGKTINKKEVEFCIKCLSVAKEGVWVQHQQGAAINSLLAEAGALLEPHHNSKTDWPELTTNSPPQPSAQHKPEFNVVAPAAQPDTDENSLVHVQSRHFKALLQCETPLEDPRLPLLPESVANIKELHTHTTELAESFREYTDLLIKRFPPDLHTRPLSYLKLCRSKLKHLAKLEISHPLLTDQIRMVNACIFVANIEQATRTHRAAQITFLSYIENKWDVTCSVLGETAKNHLITLAVEAVTQNIVRINAMLAEKRDLADAHSERIQVIRFLKKHTAVQADARVTQSTADLDRTIKQNAVTSASWYITHSITPRSLFTLSPEFSVDAVQKACQHFEYFDKAVQIHLGSAFHHLLFYNWSSFLEQPELILPLLNYPTIKSSGAGDLLRQFETALRHHTGIWDVDFSEPVIENILLTLFNPEPLDAPRLTLYGSQLHCALISCIYHLKSSDIPITPSDFDILYDRERLYDVLALIVRSLSISAPPIKKLQEVVEIHSSPGKLTDSQREKKIDLGHYLMCVHVKGYDLGNIRRSLSVTIYHNDGTGRICKIDLIPYSATELPTDEACCFFTTKTWNSRHVQGAYFPFIRGIGIEDLFHRLSLGFDAAQSMTGVKSKQRERFRKSAEQLECWLKCERTSPRLKKYSAEAPYLLDKLQHQRDWMTKMFEEEKAQEKAKLSALAPLPAKTATTATPFKAE